MNIEIITTQNKDLKESGFGSLSSCESVLNAVIRMGHNAIINVCETKEDLLNTVMRKPDLVVLGAKYLPVKDEADIWLCEYFSKYNINYTGSSKQVLKFDSNKVTAKSHLKNRGILTADYFTAIPGQYNSKDALPVKFPLFLKPMDAANGNGIDDSSYVTNFEEFENKVRSLYEEFKHPILVEEYLDGKEYTVSIIQSSSGKLLMSPIEVEPLTSINGLRILGHEAKTNSSEKLYKINDNKTKLKLTKMATEVFFGLGIRDYGCVDIKMNKAGACCFMEVNLIPEMTEGSSYFPKSCEIENNFTYDEVVALMLSQGLNRVASQVPINKKVELNSNFLGGLNIDAQIAYSQTAVDYPR